MNITFFSNNKDVVGKQDFLAWSIIESRFSKPIVCADKNAAPGWSPAVFLGRRNKKSVQTVSAAVLDYDNKCDSPVLIPAALAWWDGLTLLLHTTHSHTRELPKFRMVLPLSREVTPAEYEKIIAWLYQRVGDECDKSTRDCSRFWYMPAVASADAPFVFASRAGALLDVDSILATPELESEQCQTAEQKKTTASNPRRFYDAAIKSVAAVFAAAPHGTRNATVAREAYSIGGLLAVCGVSFEVAENDLLSAARAAGWQPYNENNELKTIRRQLNAGAARPRDLPQPKSTTPPLRLVKNETKEQPQQEHTITLRGGGENWQLELNVDKKGRLQNTLLNVTLFLTHVFDVRLDVFAEKIMLFSPPPWATSARGYPRPWSDADDIQTAVWLEREHRLVVSRALVADACAGVAAQKQFHPVRDYLLSLVWDRKPRLHSWLVDYLGAAGAGEAFTRDAGRCFLISAVARVMRPGCKVDTMIVLRGRQGAGKSTAFKILFSPWFTDEIADFGSRDAAVQCRGVWCAELAELSSLSRGETEKIKAFTSRSTDRYVQKFEKHAVEHPRQCVFGGTTNASAYLNDETGARRFWPIDVGAIDIAGLTAARDQLWAEALAHYHGGAPWWLADGNAISQQLAATSSVRHVDEWQAAIERHVIDSSSDFFTMADLLGQAIGLELSRWTQADQNRVARIMQFLGWQRYRRQVLGKQERGWLRPERAVADSD